jgi:hypothetical protein
MNSLPLSKIKSGLFPFEGAGVIGKQKPALEKTPLIPPGPPSVPDPLPDPPLDVNPPPDTPVPVPVPDELLKLLSFAEGMLHVEQHARVHTTWLPVYHKLMQWRNVLASEDCNIEGREERLAEVNRLIGPDVPHMISQQTALKLYRVVKARVHAGSCPNGTWPCQCQLCCNERASLALAENDLQGRTL